MEKTTMEVGADGVAVIAFTNPPLNLLSSDLSIVFFLSLLRFFSPYISVSSICSFDPLKKGKHRAFSFHFIFFILFDVQ